jgi:hypothetical protein
MLSGYHFHYSHKEYTDGGVEMNHEHQTSKSLLALSTTEVRWAVR